MQYTTVDEWGGRDKLPTGSSECGVSRSGRLAEQDYAVYRGLLAAGLRTQLLASHAL
jgi:hypothetical protein